MNREEANIKAKKIYEDWNKKRKQIEEQARKDGTWSNIGLDANNHLFKDINEEVKRKLEKLSSLIDED